MAVRGAETTKGGQDVEQAEADAIRDIAHKMKGSAGNFGLERLCHLLERIENDDTRPGEPLDELISAFEVEYTQALETLDRFLARMAANDPGDDRLQARG